MIEPLLIVAAAVAAVVTVAYVASTLARAARCGGDGHKLGSTNFRGQPAATRDYEGCARARREDHGAGPGPRRVVLAAATDRPLYLTDERVSVEAP